MLEIEKVWERGENPKPLNVICVMYIYVMNVGLETPLSLIWVEYQVLELDFGDFGVSLQKTQFMSY